MPHVLEMALWLRCLLSEEGGDKPVWAGFALTWEDMGCRRLFPMEIQAVS